MSVVAIVIGYWVASCCLTGYLVGFMGWRASDGSLDLEACLAVGLAPVAWPIIVGNFVSGYGTQRREIVEERRREELEAIRSVTRILESERSSPPRAGRRG